MSGGGQSSLGGGFSVPNMSTPTTSGPGVQALGNPQVGIPPWQQGLMAAITGSPQYGANAPQINQMLKGGLAQMGQQKPGQAPMMQRRPMQAGPVPQIGAAQMPQGPMPFAQPQMQGANPMMQQQSPAPWMQRQGM